MQASVALRADAVHKSAAFPVPSISDCLRTASEPSGRTSQTGLRCNEPVHILPPDQRNVIAEFLTIEFDEAMSMAVFLGAHLAKLLRLHRVESFSPSAKSS